MRSVRLLLFGIVVGAATRQEVNWNKRGVKSVVIAAAVTPGTPQDAGERAAAEPAPPQVQDSALLEGRLAERLPCVYISLAKRSDRRLKLESMTKDANLTCKRVDAIDAVSLNISGAEACTRSHIKALDDLWASGVAYGLVLEDDAMWKVPSAVRDGLLDRVGEGLKKHPVLMLSCNGWGGNTSLPWLRKAERCLTSSSYIIRRDYIPVLRENFANCKEALDLAWLPLQEKDNWAMFEPLLIKQAPSYSDIEHREVDYGVLREDGTSITKSTERIRPQ